MQTNLEPFRPPDFVVTNAVIAPCVNPATTAASPTEIKRATMLVREGRIVEVLPESDVRRSWVDVAQIDAAGYLVTPGFVDCHTHPVFAGHRADEFERRIAGAKYLEIAEGGGGIQRSVIATRAASEDELERLVRGRLARALSFGVTTVEAKSGYGLDTENELRALRILKRATLGQPVDVVPTFLGAHVVPREFRHDRRAYIEKITTEMIPEISFDGLAAFCDVFVDEGAFTIDEARAGVAVARRFGLKPKVHADQLSCTHAAELAAEVGATSADHLERISPAGIDALAAAGVVAVILPGAALGPGDHVVAPARRLIAAGAHVAVATDLNPGTSMTENLLLMGSLACMRYGLSPSESLYAMTNAAARAVGLEARVGSLEAGKEADFVLWGVRSTAELFYHFGVSHAVRIWKAGREVTF